MFRLDAGTNGGFDSQSLLVFLFVVAPILVPLLVVWHEEAKALLLALLTLGLELAVRIVEMLCGQTRAPP